MQPIFPRLSTCIRFVGRLASPPSPGNDDVDDRDVLDEVTVEVRVREEGVPLLLRGTACASRSTLPADELRVAWRERLSREKDAKGPRIGG
jgi:hypothetical protein